MTVLGHWMVVLALVASGVAALGYIRNAAGQASRLLRPQLFLGLSTLFIGLASVALLVLLVTHDFSNGYVFSYSDRSLPLHFLISSFYAGQEGSFLFWALCSTVIAIVLARSTRRRGTEPSVMGVFMVVQSFLLLLVLAKSPFRTLWEMFPAAPVGQMPANGRGLNPLLQNFWMVIHPPVLFLGFAAMAVPFSFALAGLWKREFAILPRQAFPWVLFATSVLGLGIMLGAYWAYGVLGWGGYWGWDPVENSSLVPWLTGVALLHTMLAQLRTGKFARTNMMLALVSFLLVVYSTFLTRSGILGDASVHAFTDPGATVYWLLLGALTLIAVSSIVLVALRWRAMAPAASDAMFLTRESALGAGAIALVLSALVVLFGTSLPIFSTTRVEPSFYDATNLPIALAMMVLVGFSLYTQWEFQDGRDLLRRSMRSLAITLVAGMILFFVGVREAWMLLLSTGSVFAIVVNIDIAFKVVKGDWRFLGGKVAHMGIALFLLGVVATGRYASTERLALPLNVPQQALGRTFTFTGAAVRPDGKTGFTVMVQEGTSSLRLEPVMFDAGDQGVMKNPDIAAFITRDIYVSPLSYEEGTPGSGMEYTIARGKSLDAGGAQVRFVGFDMKGEHDAMAQAADGSIKVGATLEITRGDARETIVPAVIARPGKAGEFPPVHSSVLNANVRLAGMDVGDAANASVRVSVEHDGEGAQPGVLILEASVKPFVSLLWTGTVIMLAGFGLAIAKRTKEKVR